MNNIPTISELQAGIIADLESQYSITIPTFGKSLLRALAYVQAAKLKLVYLSIAKLQQNIAPDTAERELIGGTLERFGRIKLNRNPFPAVQGQYILQVTGQIGAIIPASTTFKSNDDTTNPGKLFVVDNAYTLTATTDTVVIRALEAGTDSKMAIGEGLTATAPIANVDSAAGIQNTFIDPLAAEDIEVYRQKVLDAYRLEAQGGAATDYRLWSYDAQGVEQVYPYAKSNASNEINLFVEATIADSTDGFGTPSAALLLAVEDVVEFDPDTTKPLNERGRRPLGVFQVHYLPITPKQIDIIISSFTGITPTIEAVILAAMESAINNIRPFVAGADILDEKNDILDTNKIIGVILNARPGSTFGAVTLKVDGVAYSTWTFVNGDIPILNSITYI